MPRYPHTLAEIRAVDLFVAYLYDLPLADWVEVARHHNEDRRTPHATPALSEALRRFVDPRAIFETRDAVLSALQRFDTPEGRRATRWRSATRHLRPATENAALAVLARRHLDADTFASIYAPFEPVISSALLFGLDER
ncbi:MAG TPA: hypothetical protein VIP11_15565 [Gemmatimonadaceae bacterium]